MSAFVRPDAAFADDKKTLSGSWTASALSEKWSTTEWGDACGPKPTPQGAPGGAVTIAEQGGELAISGAGRAFSTSQCWEQMPGLSRSSHSAGSRGWSTRCTSAAGDPRHATVVTNISATDDTIVLAETGNYEFFLEGSKCQATVSRSRSFKIVQRAGEEATPVPTAQPTAKPAPAPPPPSEPAPTACSEPGPATKLEVRPQKKLLRPGETFTLSAIVTDEKGCRLGARPSFKVDDDPSGKVTVESDGKVTAASDAAEGARVIVVDLGGKQIKVGVEIVANDRYDALLKERGLNPLGEDDSAATVEIASGLGGSQSTSEDAGKKRKQIFIGVVSGVAAFLALAGFILVRRGKRARPPEDDGRDLTPAEPPAVALFDSAPNQMMRCPSCEELFAPTTGFCPNDGAALVPSGVLSVPPPSSGERPIPSSRARSKIDKICPTCGDRFAGDAEFCGKDGTSLVPIN